MILHALGRLLRGAFRRAERIVRASPLTQRELSEAVARAYMEGARVGRTYHAAEHGIRAVMPPAELRAAIEAALEHGDRFGVRLAEFLDRPGRPVSAALALNTTGIAARLAVWTGQDEQAARVAEIDNSEWKRWIRTFERKVHRDHHDALEGVTIPADRRFVLPGGNNSGATVTGPRDWAAVSDPGEWVNCGHALQYLRVVTQNDLTTASR